MRARSARKPMWECEWCRKPNYEESLTCEHCGGARNLSVDPYYPMRTTETTTLATAPPNHAWDQAGMFCTYVSEPAPSLFTARKERQAQDPTSETVWSRWRDWVLGREDA